MAGRVENSIEVDAPIGEVFAFVDDYRNATRFIVGMKVYKPLTKQVSGKGSKFHFVKKTSGLPDIKSDVVCTVWAKDKKVITESFAGFDNTGHYTFVSKGGKTTVKAVSTFELASLVGGGRGGILGGIGKAVGGVASRAAEGQVRKDLAKSMENLRDLIEAGRKTAAPRKPKGSPANKARASAKKAVNRK
jgi:uncharacterized membrane protein